MNAFDALQQPVPISSSKYFLTSSFSPEIYEDEEEEDFINSLAMEDFRSVMYSPLSSYTDYPEENNYERSSNPLICNRFFSSENTQILL